MPYVITNPSRITRSCVVTGLSFPRGKTRISDEKYTMLQSSKVLGAMLKEGLLTATAEQPAKASGSSSSAKSKAAPKGAGTEAEVSVAVKG